MDETAIKRIEALAAASQADRETFIPTAVIPAECTIASLENFMQSPARARQTFKTQRISDLVNYVQNEAVAEQTAVFIDPDRSGADAIIDYGTHANPLWGSHKAQLRPEATPEFAALERVSNADGLTQRDLINWIEDWHDVITVMGDANDAFEISHAQAVAAIRRVDINASSSRTHRENDFSASHESLDSIEAKSGDSALPAEFHVQCRIYPDLGERTVRARLTLRTSDSKPRFGLRIVALDRLMQETADEIERNIRSALDDHARIFVGDVR